MYKKIKELYKSYESAHESAHGLENEMRYTEPKIYTGKNDLKKRWYVYYSVENPETGKMVRQPNLSMGINRYKTVKERLKRFRTLRIAIHDALKEGHSPYNDEIEFETDKMPAEKAILEVLEMKSKVIKESTYSDYKTRTTLFLKFLKTNKLLYAEIKEIDRKVVNKYLDQVLIKSGARNRNNSKSVLSAIFSSLVSKGYIDFNFIKSIENLKTDSKRDRTISTNDLETILEYLEKHDPLLLFYVQFISFFFLRPVEVNRLKIGSVNLKEKLITVETKQKASKTKIIPELIFQKLKKYMTTTTNPDHYLFTPEGPGHSDSKETNRRNHFSKRFLKVKRALKLPKEYSLYSFRHTYITKVYKELRKEYTIDETVAKLKLITGHESEAIQRYIHLIDAELPENYSYLLK